MSLAGKRYTTGELAVLLLVSPRTVRKWIDRGGLTATLVGKSSRRHVSHEDLLVWLGRVWPAWRTEVRGYYDGQPDNWWRGVIQQRVARWPWLRDWLALLGCETQFAEPLSWPTALSSHGQPT